MIKIGQIMDKESKGLNYLENYHGQHVVIPQPQMIETFIAEVIRFDELNKPVEFIREIEVIIDLNNLGVVSTIQEVEVNNEITQVEVTRPKTIREIIQEQI